MKYISIVYIVLFDIIYLLGQKSECNNLDSLKCYSLEKRITSNLGLKVYLESEDLFRTNTMASIIDVDNDCIPELVVYDSTGYKVLILDSKTGRLKSQINTINIDSDASILTMGDIDYDGIPELFVLADFGFRNSIFDRGFLYCYKVDGTLVWKSNVRVDFNNFNDRQIDGKVGLADFNQDGVPEVYINNKIFNSITGRLLAHGGSNGLGHVKTPLYDRGTVSIAADLDDNESDLELAAGYTIYKVSIVSLNDSIGNSMTPYNIMVDNEFRDGFTSVADLDLDGKLEVLVSYVNPKGGSILYAFKLNNGASRLVAKSYPSIVGISSVSTPGICKLRNGNPSIIVSHESKLFSYTYTSNGVLNKDWELAITDSSTFASTSFFDLDSDGNNEIIYRDEEELIIINEKLNNPFVVSRIPCGSSTYHEYPVIADIDNSGHSKICVTCAKNSNYYTGHLTVFGPKDTLPGWAPARGIWNQYAYNPLFINDDLTVPRYQKNQATYKNGKYNNFMQQESLLDSNGYYKRPAASLRGQIQCINYDPIANEYLGFFDLYNRKDASNSADSGLAVSFYNGDPTNGGTLIGIYYTLKSINPGDSLLNLQFRFSASNLTDLFMVINTIRNGNGNFEDKDFKQAECDYTDNISRTVELPKVENRMASICKGSTYQFVDTTIQDAGRYYRKLSSTKACDSVIFILDLTTVDTIKIAQSAQACDNYLWNGKNLIQSGTYQFDTVNQFGCDSITTLDLKINKSNSAIIQQTTCNSYTWNGIIYDQSGSYTYQTINQDGCDSIAKLELVIHKSDTTKLDITTCNSYSWNGRNYLQSGIYTLDTINQFGCDSAVQLNLNINSEILVSISQTACDSYNWNGKLLKQSGIYTDTTQSSKGCDSITTLQLIINNSNSSSSIQTSCDSYTWNGIKYTQSGSYSFTTQTSSGCDSIANLQLTITKSSNSITNISRCNSYSWNNITYSQSGSYQYQTLNANGCDSIATLNLVIYPSDSLTQRQTACNSYNWNNKTYTLSGKYVFQSTNINGCDSIVTLDLNIISNTTKDTSTTICDSLNFLGKTLKTSGNYSFTIPNAQGCDSIINLQLSISSQKYQESVSRCGSYIWPINGRKYDSSGIYEIKYSNSSACDSSYLLNLIIHKNYEILDTAEACKEYLWPVNQQVYTKSGAYSMPLKTVQGCDSILNLNLTVHPEYQHSDTVTTNSDYTWPVNRKTYTSNGTYEEDYVSFSGCDSIHLLLLTINKEISIYYPNIIHPGGVNEWFTIFVYGNSASIKVLSIYDRWGELIWQKQSFPPNELQKGWNGQFKGKNVLPGVYVWHAEVQLPDGRVVIEKGDVTVLR